MQSIIQNLSELEPFPHLKKLYTDYSYCRVQLMLNSYSVDKAVKRMLEDKTFKNSLRLELSEQDRVMMPRIVGVCGEDFKGGMCLAVRIKESKGKVTMASL